MFDAKKTAEEMVGHSIKCGVRMFLEKSDCTCGRAGEVEKVAAALSQAYADALERAAKVADAEAELYKQNARKCDAAKNYAGGMHDTCGALACLRVRDAIRSLPLEPQPLETKGTDNGG